MATKNDIYAKIGIFVIGLINFILLFATSLAPSLPPSKMGDLGEFEVLVVGTELTQCQRALYGGWAGTLS